jgi:hypothetical protein
MVKTSNSKAEYYVHNRINFKGNNTFGQWKGVVYKVYSYGYHFPIYAYKAGQWYKNKDKYSVSTSKHQSQLHPRDNCILLNTEEIKTI